MEDERGAWADVGERVRSAREDLRPEVTIREAARRAGFSDATWRKLEVGGFTQHGNWAPPNLTNRNLEAAAVVVGLDPVELFASVGREYRGPYSLLVEDQDDEEALRALRGRLVERAGDSRAALSGKIERLSEEDRQHIEAIVDSLLGEES